MILKSKIGIYYTDQVSGLLCLHPIVEGFGKKKRISKFIEDSSVGVCNDKR